MSNSNILWLTLSVVLLFSYMGYCQEWNFGKKVKCFVMQGSIVCPGCNSRSGRTCPRRPEGRPEFESCETTTPEIIIQQEEITETNTDTTTATLPYDYDKMEASFINRSHLFFFLYRSLGPIKRTIKTRSVDEQDAGLETCRWVGDCPCPLICCNRGAGCPKKCIKGIRLPPHIYPG